MSVEHSLLGKDTNYPTEYQPGILFPIARAQAREQYAQVEGIQQGKDWWHVFEISWLNHAGIPQVAIGRLTLPAASPNLIESKSLKLYFNSMNFPLRYIINFLWINTPLVITFIIFPIKIKKVIKTNRSFFIHRNRFNPFT